MKHTFQIELEAKGKPNRFVNALFRAVDHALDSDIEGAEALVRGPVKNVRVSLPERKKVWISAAVPTEGADTYDGIRIAISDTEDEAFEDLREWLNMLEDVEEDYEGVEHTRDALEGSREVRFWNVESREVDFNA